MQTGAPLRVLILAPVGRDAELMCLHLMNARIECEACRDVDHLCEELRAGAGALLFTEEALTPDAMTRLARVLEEQPPWSDIPVLVLTGIPSVDARARSFALLGRRATLTLVDRPVRIQSLVSTTVAALSARARQYEVRDLMQKLEDRIHERDRFLAILGHELRNPLGAILLASQMADHDGRLDGEHARLIERQSRHLTRIVNDLLDLSRVVSGKIVLRRQRVDLRHSAQQVLDTLRESARNQHIDLQLEVPDSPVLVMGDPVRIDQILSNVVTNAIKYTPEGGHVRVAIRHAGPEALLVVTDDGVGIAPDRIGSIFELFAQAENTIGRAQGGMGIGLALVRNLVELHGGTIGAESEGVGKGATFTIRFPPASDASSRHEESEERPLPPAGGGRQRRIVIVEDNGDVRELLKLKLRRLGHRVEAVADGPSGVSAIVASRPDMALIDIGLPVLDGYEVASRVRGELGNEVVLVAVSGFGQPEDKRRALEAGFDEHITKPTDVQDIESVLARFPPRRNESPA